MRNRVKEQIKRNFKHRDDDDEDGESEYMELPGKKIKRKKKKNKKKKKEPTIDERDLMMAKAYGGLSQAQVDRLVADKRRKEL